MSDSDIQADLDIMANYEAPTAYTCYTQQNLAAELLSPSQTKEAEGSSDRGNDSIVVGMKTEVPRWDVKKQGPRQLKYFVQTDGFPSPQSAQRAGATFQKAADQWNALELGISIVGAPDAASAHFDLVYNKPEDPKDTTLASAFFPHERNEDVIVYTSAMHPKNKDELVNIFAHEIGHILGLRHEFAITGDKEKGLKAEGGAVEYMEPNYYSVMSYNFPPTIQDSDKTSIKAFYKLEDGHVINGLPVTDYVPVLKKRS